MKKLLQNLLFSFLILSTFVGCTSLRDLTPEEFRTQEFYCKTVQVHKSISEIKEAFYLDMPNRLWESRYKITNYREDPLGKTASIWWEVGGLAKLATMAVMDFRQESTNPNLTSVKIYAANSMWEREPQHILDLLAPYTPPSKK